MLAYAFSRCRRVNMRSALPRIIPAGQSSLVGLGKRECAWPVGCMTSGRFFLAGTTAIFRTHHRRCERRSRCGNREKRQSNDPYCGQPRRPGYVVRDAVLGHFLSRHRHQRDWRRCRGDLTRNRFIPDFSFNHVGALYRSTIHSAMHSIRRYDQLKKRPSQGWRLGRFGGFTGQTAR